MAITSLTINSFPVASKRAAKRGCLPAAFSQPTERELHLVWLCIAWHCDGNDSYLLLWNCGVASSV
jgi:hypothetical protein